MSSRSHFLPLRATLALAALILGMTLAAQAQTETVLHAFTGREDGAVPDGGLVFDAAGNLYGVTAGGGSTSCTGGCGVAFKLSPTSSGAWRETQLFSFSHTSGTGPIGSLLLNSSGDLFGVAPSGSFTQGLVFELSPASKGDWHQTLIYLFNGPGDGAYPQDSFIADNAGNLYGVTPNGGNTTACSGIGCGTVIELSPTSSGFWRETTLYAFNGGADGANPMAHLTFDAAGNLYGTTAFGGNLTGKCPLLGCGVVFQLAPSSSGTWTQTVVHSFTGLDGAGPMASLTIDAAGDLYGTTLWGGKHCPSAGCGVAFELTPGLSGQWQETVLHDFQSNGDGAGPSSGMVLDSTGALYGTTTNGGIAASCGGVGCGVIFKLTPTAGGPWTYTRLHAFTGGVDGAEIGGPFRNMPLIFGADGNLYGAASGGGAHGAGVVFEITP